MASGDPIYATTSPDDQDFYTDGATWAVALAGTNVPEGSSAATTNVGLFVAPTYATEYFLAFDLSGIPAGATIDSATYAPWYTHLDHCNGQVEEIYAFDWGAAPDGRSIAGTAGADWRTGGSTGWFSSNPSALVATHTPAVGDGMTAYTPFTVDETNMVNAINAALADDGILRLVAICDLYRADTAPANSDYSTTCYTADGTHPPRLVPTYTEGAPADLPTLTTMAITAITRTTASGGGNITDEGDSPVTTYGVCWNTSGTPIITDSHTHDE